MGLLSHKVEKKNIKPGDHIYTWRTAFTYSHHGIFVGGSKVVHFTRNMPGAVVESTDLMKDVSSSCPTFPDCGFKKSNSGVVVSCLDCFLGNGSPYLFEYGVTSSAFLAKVRAGTCTMAEADPPETVIHRAMYLLHNGFGNYDVFKNNCEDFALYCKTGLLIVDTPETVGRSGQASFAYGAPLVGLLYSPLKLLMPNPLVAVATAGMYCVSRYGADVGVRGDVIKIAVEDLAVNLGWNRPGEEVTDEGNSCALITL